MVCGLLIVTLHTNCDVTSCPVIMRHYTNADGDEQRYKTSKSQVSLAFCKIVIVVEYKLTTYTVCAVVVGTAIWHSTRCAGRRGRKWPAMAGTTRAVPDCSTKHSIADYSHKDQFMPISVIIDLVWIATNQTIGTNVKKSYLIIVKKKCHVNGTPVFPSAPSTFPSIDCKYTNWAL